MKILNYIYNIVRLTRLKITGKYLGPVFQSIPMSTKIISDFSGGDCPKSLRN